MKFIFERNTIKPNSIIHENKLKHNRIDIFRKTDK